MTGRELLQKLKDMPDHHLDCRVVVDKELSLLDKAVDKDDSLIEVGTIGVKQDLSGDNEYLLLETNTYGRVK